MASQAPNKSMIGRAAAILTTGEVAGAALDLNNAWGSFVSVDLTFTLGSLTSMDVRFYVSADGVTYDPVYNADGTELTDNLTASSEIAYILPPLIGWKWFRASVQGTGNVTNSSCAFVYRYLRRGSQG